MGKMDISDEKELDLGELSSVETFVDEFLSLNKPLHYLILNAGISKPGKERMTTVDGLEEHFGVNHVGHFLLAGLLLNKVKQSGTPESMARIVIVASRAHRSDLGTKPLNLDDLQLELPRAYAGHQAYKNSKLGNVILAKKLAKVLVNDNVVVNTMCPGVIPDTEITRHYKGCMRYLFCGMICLCFPCFLYMRRTVNHGGQMIAFLTTDVKVEKVSGEYFEDFKPTPASPQACDEQTQDRLWQATIYMIDSKLPGLKLF